MKHISLILKGFCIGIANIIPGVSGGTMAFILGIYEELIESIRSFDLVFLKKLLKFKWEEAFKSTAWQFLGCVLFGILLATFSLSKLLGWLLSNRTIGVYSFFFGLIIASALIVGRSIKKWSLATILGLAISAVVSFFLVGIVPVATPDTLWFLFFCAAIAICAMILPGISGAFILLILGKYEYILNAVNERNFLVLGVFALGAAAGIVAFTRVLNWLLRNYYQVTLTALTGLMIGSLRRIWPFKETMQFMVDSRGKVIPLIQKNIWPAADQEVFIAVFLLILGFAVAYGLDFHTQKSNS